MRTAVRVHVERDGGPWARDRWTVIAPPGAALVDVKKAVLFSALLNADGNKARAASALGVSYRSLSHRLAAAFGEGA